MTVWLPRTFQVERLAASPSRPLFLFGPEHGTGRVEGLRARRVERELDVAARLVGPVLAAVQEEQRSQRAESELPAHLVLGAVGRRQADGLVLPPGLVGRRPTEAEGLGRRRHPGWRPRRSRSPPRGRPRRRTTAWARARPAGPDRRGRARSGCGNRRRRWAPVRRGCGGRCRSLPRPLGPRLRRCSPRARRGRRAPPPRYRGGRRRTRSRSAGTRRGRGRASP